MWSPPRTSRRFSAWFAMAVVAVLVRALIPTGYMVAPDQAFRLVICTGHGPAVSRNDRETPSRAPQKPDQACAFAGFHAATSSPAPAMVVAVAQDWVAAAPRMGSLDLGLMLDVPAPALFIFSWMSGCASRIMPSTCLNSEGLNSS